MKSSLNSYPHLASLTTLPLNIISKADVTSNILQGIVAATH